MIAFVLGVFVGAFIGIALMCLLQIGKDTNEDQF